MIRRLYVLLLRLHPARFRQRYAAEMLWIFDQAAASRGARSLFADACLSLWRQWMLRPQYRRESTLAVQPALDGVPSFYIGGSDTPRTGALLHGGVLSLLVFAAVCYILSHSNSHPAFFIQIGSHNHSFSHFLQAHTRSAASRDVRTEIKVKPEPQAHRVSPYFRLMPVLRALDEDNDGVISSMEISEATLALLGLDKNHDNKLSAAECGLELRYPSAIIRSRFMRLHPVLAALDSDHDGEISGREILNAPAALLTLDKNGDGRLTEDELLPDAASMGEALRISGNHKQE